uniref:FAD-binding domain-containing protein n=1 Tax=Kalanchoe fedtschenkoi TaxID=63787 RepID=A0A7N0U4U9_KALFE
MDQQSDVVIVGGGICGVACALALQRKGIRSVVLERSDDLRVTGTSIIMASNGWYALEQLGVASMLRHTAVLIERATRVNLASGARTPLTFGIAQGEKAEVRSLKRKDLLEVMAGQLFPNTIYFGRRVTSMEMDPDTLCPLLALNDGTQLKAKIVIGCDGANSLIGKHIGLKDSDMLPVTVVRGFTRYEDGHPFENEMMVWNSPPPEIQVGRLPMTNKVVYWFVCWGVTSEDSAIADNPKLIKESTLRAVQSFPKEAQDMIKVCHEESLHLGQPRYRRPWELLRRNFHKGAVVLAGDALHSMGPFIAQGGAASLEDAVVLARCLSVALHKEKSFISPTLVEKALIQYGKERRMRVVKLMTQSYLLATLMWPSSRFMKIFALILLIVFFGRAGDQANFKCGEL